jgi:hypothetical protein
MAKLKLIVTVLLMAGVAILWVVGRQSEARLQVAQQEQVDRTAQLKAEQERLANLLAQANDPTAGKQLAELTKLRDEATRLRQQAGELQELRTQNGQLRSALQGSQGRPTAAPATVPDKPPLAVYPKAAWAFAGYATPEAALQSFLWANANGDIDTMLTCLTADAQKQIAKSIGDKPASEVAETMKNKMTEYTEFRLLSKNAISDTEVELGIWNDKSGTDKMFFEKIDGQWKFSPEARAKAAQP